MNQLQIIGHKPTIKNTETGERQSFPDYQKLCEFISKKGIKVAGLHRLPKFYQDFVGYQEPEPHIDHIVQFTDPEKGGLS